jgi:hypothetical protein
MFFTFVKYKITILTSLKFVLYRHSYCALLGKEKAAQANNLAA